MKLHAYTVTLAVAAAASFGTQVASAHLLARDGSYASVKSASSQATLGTMQVAGINFHASAKGTRLAGSTGTVKSTRNAVRPDDRPGPRL